MDSCVFFFQAEDGIRDLVRSRGLGDVYKRQQLTARFAELEPKLVTPTCEFGILAGGRGDETGYNLSLIHI